MTQAKCVCGSNAWAIVDCVLVCTKCAKKIVLPPSVVNLAVYVNSKTGGK
jgi:hypothetical protein